MSTRNRQRRAANAEARRTASQSAAAHGPSGPAGSRVDHLSPGELVDAAIELTWRGDGTVVGEVLVAPIARDLAGFRAEVGPRLLQGIASVWARGWQPVEAARHVRRGCSPAALRLVLAAVAADHRGRSPSSLDVRWAAQTDSLDLPSLDADGAVSSTTSGGAWVRAWMVGEDLPTHELIVAVIDLLVRLMSMPVLEPLIAPPGAGPDWRAKVAGPTDATSTGAEADPVLEKVRALLAKAESTSFEAEAEAFTAKAQQLIARHAIDAALLAVDDGDDGPSAIRVFIDDPYVDAKSLLLHVVAQSGRCRAAFISSVAMSTVVGFASDLAAVQMLFTSLLVQAQTAMAAAARSAPPGSRARSRGFRSSFLQSYASRIGQRLDEINAEVVAESEAEAEAGHGRSILPVLASREAAVDEALDDLFGSLTTRRMRGGQDAAGWASGRFAADNAQLGAGSLDGGVPAAP